DSWLTFHDPNSAWFSMGLDYSNSRFLCINAGPEPGSASQFVMTHEGKIGIGANPRAMFDVSMDIKNSTLGSVFGRLGEGGDVGDGTYLGVRGFGTQNDVYNGKAFSLEHSFYGVVNSSINFFRGTNSQDGFVTFNTYNSIERMRI